MLFLTGLGSFSTTDCGNNDCIAAVPSATLAPGAADWVSACTGAAFEISTAEARSRALRPSRNEIAFFNRESNRSYLWVLAKETWSCREDISRRPSEGRVRNVERKTTTHCCHAYPTP